MNDGHVLTDRLLRIGAIETRVREGGTGPLVVFLHGTSGNATVWDPILQDLLPNFHVVAIDQRGHGLSSKPVHGYTAANFTQDLAGVIESLDSTGAVVVGHSLGARNAVVLGATHPRLVRGVVAIDFTPFLDDEIFDGIAARVGGGSRTFTSTREIEDYLVARYPRFPKAAIQRRVVNGYTKASLDGYVPLADANAMKETTEGLREDFEWAVREVACPVILIRGAESALVSADAFNRTMMIRPDFRGITLEGIDHYIPEVLPELVGQIVSDFLHELG